MRPANSPGLRPMYDAAAYIPTGMWANAQRDGRPVLYC